MRPPASASREQQGRGGVHDAGVVHTGEQEERSDPETEPALPAVSSHGYVLA